MRLNKNSILKKQENIVHSVMPTGVILLNLDTGYYFSTNETGSRIWELCDGINSADEIVTEISNQSQTSPTEISNDIMELLESMFKENLLEVVS